MPEIFVTNLNDSGEGSLRYVLLGAVPQTTIKFSPELLGGSIELETPLSVTVNDLVIDGEGKISFFAKNRCRLVEIKSGLKCRLKGLVIERGYAESDGGGIYVHPKSNLTLESVKFCHNISKFVGGAIFVANDSILTVQDCRFEANEALSSQCNLTKGVGRGGGAIATQTRTNVLIKNSKFFNN